MSTLVYLCLALGVRVQASPGDSLRSSAVPDTVYVVAPIVVEADRLDRRPDLFGRTGFVAGLDVSQRRGRVEDLGGVLSSAVGLRVKEYGGLGHYATVSIRGSSSNQVKLYVDGVPVDDAWAGTLDLSMLPLGGVRRVEVYRGFAPPGLGPAAIGGAINIVTVDPRNMGGGWLSRVDASTSYGSYNTSRHRLSVWSSPPGVDLFVHGGFTRSLGDFEFDDDNGTPFEPGDDAASVRANNDFDAWNLLARAVADAGGAVTVSAGHESVRREGGVPGLGVNQSTSARSWSRRRTSHLRLEPGAWLGGGLRFSAMAFYSKSVEQFTDLEGDIGLGRQDTDNSAHSYGARARGGWTPPGVPASLEVVFDSRKERFHPVSKVPAPVSGPDRWRRTHTTAVTGEVFPFDQRLVLSATYRLERHVNEFYDAAPFPWLPPTPQGRVSREEETPSAGARLQPLPWLTVKGNAGRYYRLPTFLELFGNSGSVTGNAALVPEQGINRDIGLVLSWNRAGVIRRPYVEVVYLDNEVDDLILYFPNSQRTSKPSNIGSATIRGWEATASASAGALDLAVNYSFLDTEDTSDIPYYAGNELPARPRHDLFTSAAGTWRGWKLTWEFHHIGANYLDRANLDEAPGRNLHNVILQTGLTTPGLSDAGLSLTLEARNLTDARAEDVGGFPLPGRSFFSTLTYRFTPEGG